jgi:TonB family protein
MKLWIKYLFISIWFYSFVWPQHADIKSKFSSKFSEQPLKLVLEYFEEKYNVKFIYSDNLIEDKLITIELQNVTLETALNKILFGSKLSYKIFNEKNIVLFRNIKKVQKTAVLKPVVVQKNIPERDTVVMQKPILITEQKMFYPEEAIKGNIEGNVTLSFLVDANGKVQKIIVSQSSGSDILDSATVNYTRGLKFIPAKVNGVPRKLWISKRFEFFFVKN